MINAVVGFPQALYAAHDKARIAASQLKYGRYVNWWEKRAKEKYYLGEIKREFHEARSEEILTD